MRVLGTVVIVVLAATVARADVPVVAVSYFDNTSGKADLAPLRKGLADMLITDLAGLQAVQIVEREKLDKLLAEIRLGDTKYINPTTAQRLGRGLNATHVLTGSYLIERDQLRIDVRLVRVESGQVVLTDKQVGPAGNVFALEGALVAKLAAALQSGLRHAHRIQMSARTPSSASDLLLYGQCLDAQDRGDVERARTMLKQLLAHAPMFMLAAVRLNEIEETLRKSAVTRSSGLPEELAALALRSRQGEMAVCSSFKEKFVHLMCEPLQEALPGPCVRAVGVKTSGLTNLTEAQIGVRLYKLYRFVDFVLSAKLPDGVCGEYNPNQTVLYEMVSVLWVHEKQTQSRDETHNPRCRAYRATTHAERKLLPLSCRHQEPCKPIPMFDPKGHVTVKPQRYKALILGYGNAYLKRFPTGRESSLVAKMIKDAISSGRSHAPRDQ